MSCSQGCRCEVKDRSKWRVHVYRANYSSFNGNRRTPSDYSAVHCTGCNAAWRTKAAYVESLPFAEGCR